MIWGMHKRIAGFVTLLVLAAAATSRPALAQDADGEWFDGASDPGQAPQPAQGDPQVPAYGPQGQAMPGASAQPAPIDNVPETDPRALTEFRPTLDPYGTWVEDEKYGTVWVPNRDAVGEDFAPYVTAGHWALTDDNDWSWQSDYPFGNVVFHYGRWVWVPGTGWAWVAGRQYANAWVNWRVPTDDYGYIGWAPMPPAWGWYGGSAVSLWWYPPAPYVFCPSGYAFSYNVHSYIVHDRYVIHDVAAHTRNYGGGGHIAASPRVLPANSAPMRGPSLQSVHIPAGSASRVSGGFAAGGRFAGSSSARPAAFRSDGSYSRPYNATPRSYSNSTNYARPSSNAGNYAGPSSGSNYQRPVNTTQYTYSRPTNYQSYHAAPQRAYSAPSSSARPYNATPQRSYSAPSTAFHSAPARSYSAPSYSAPSTSYHAAPAQSFHSAPARSYSAPSFHSSSSHGRR